MLTTLNGKLMSLSDLTSKLMHLYSILYRLELLLLTFSEKKTNLKASIQLVPYESEINGKQGKQLEDATHHT